LSPTGIKIFSDLENILGRREESEWLNVPDSKSGFSVKNTSHSNPPQSRRFDFQKNIINPVS
jgi:hypothetical protein